LGKKKKWWKKKHGGKKMVEKKHGGQNKDHFFPTNPTIQLIDSNIFE